MANSPPEQERAIASDQRLLAEIQIAQKVLDLSFLGNGMPGLTPACGTVLAESAAVCLENRTHRQGVLLTVKAEKNAEYPLLWAGVDEQQRRCHNDLQEATERGASGIAILLVEQMTGMRVLERSSGVSQSNHYLGCLVL